MLLTFQFHNQILALFLCLDTSIANTYRHAASAFSQTQVADSLNLSKLNRANLLSKPVTARQERLNLYMPSEKPEDLKMPVFMVIYFEECREVDYARAQAFQRLCP